MSLAEQEEDGEWCSRRTKKACWGKGNENGLICAPSLRFAMPLLRKASAIKSPCLASIVPHSCFLQQMMSRSTKGDSRGTRT
jgi:hypothetical protein